MPGQARPPGQVWTSGQEAALARMVAGFFGKFFPESV
jgi:hypothetical protein